MARSRYNFEIALNRLLRKMEGKPVTSDRQEFPGEILNQENAMSDIAELWEGSLPGETLQIPAAGLPFASVAEANAGTASDVIISPESHTWAHEYAGIYVHTGTVQQSFTANVWTKITGAFQNDMIDSGDVYGDWNDDRIIVNETGTYLVLWQLSLLSCGDAGTLIGVQAYVSGTAAITTRSWVSSPVSGSYFQMNGLGVTSIGGYGFPVDLRLSPSTTQEYSVRAAELFIEKMNG